MRYLGIDYGTQKVGTALSDEAGTMGFPHEVFKNTEQLLPELVSLITLKEVGAVVVGDTDAGRAFGEVLAKATGVPVHYELEAYTTQEARRAPDGARTKQREHTDASAAALILTSYLSRSHD